MQNRRPLPSGSYQDDTSWRYTLDVVNCAGFPGDVLEHRVYICPVRGRNYSHKRCRYFGMYAGSKRVIRIAEIRAVVDVMNDENAVLLWKNVSEPEASLVQEAVAKVRELRGEFPYRAFLLGELYPTVFTKDSPNGMLASKIYFDLSRFAPADTKAVAHLLYNKTWSEIRGTVQQE